MQKNGKEKEAKIEGRRSYEGQRQVASAICNEQRWRLSAEVIEFADLQTKFALWR